MRNIGRLTSAQIEGSMGGRTTWSSFFFFFNATYLPRAEPLLHTFPERYRQRRLLCHYIRSLTNFFPIRALDATPAFGKSRERVGVFRRTRIVTKSKVGLSVARVDRWR